MGIRLCLTVTIWRLSPPWPEWWEIVAVGWN
jgi:hypothetical protein